MKITVIGDLMCEPPLLKAAKRKDGSYSFDETFEKIKLMLDEADFVIGNLEFPLAGAEAGYTDGFYCFNVPDSYVDAVKRAGIDLVSTVNNHTLDRGVDGMLRTLDVLDRAELPHTGSFRSAEAHEEAAYFTVGDTTFALVAYTYTTNKRIPDDSEYMGAINLLRPLRAKTYLPEVAKKMKTWVDRLFPKLKGEHRSRIKMLVGLPNTVERADDYIDREASLPYMQRFSEDIRTAKEKADVVIAYPHVGGQFNREPGAFSKWTVEEALAAGADAVIASHSHTVQRAELRDGVPVAYSIGNVTMTPNSTIILKESLPEYGIALHLYYDGKTLQKTTFTILKAVEKRGRQLVAWPAHLLYTTLEKEKEKKKLLAEAKTVYRFFTGRELPEGELAAEYPL